LPVSLRGPVASTLSELLWRNACSVGRWVDDDPGDRPGAVVADLANAHNPDPARPRIRLVKKLTRKKTSNARRTVRFEETMRGPCAASRDFPAPVRLQTADEMIMLGVHQRTAGTHSVPDVRSCVSGSGVAPISSGSHRLSVDLIGHSAADHIDRGGDGRGAGSSDKDHSILNYSEGSGRADLIEVAAKALGFAVSLAC